MFGKTPAYMWTRSGNKGLGTERHCLSKLSTVGHSFLQLKKELKSSAYIRKGILSKVGARGRRERVGQVKMIFDLLLN